MQNPKHKRLEEIISSLIDLRKEIQVFRREANEEFQNTLMNSRIPDKGKELKADEWRLIGKAEDECINLLTNLGDYMWHRFWDDIYKDSPNYETLRKTRQGYEKDDTV